MLFGFNSQTGTPEKLVEGCYWMQYTHFWDLPFVVLHTLLGL